MTLTDDPSTDAPPPRNKGGRPGLGTEEITDAFERFVAREGRAPSQTELRRELGDRGSFTTLARVRTALIGERLLAGTDTPTPGQPEGVLLKAVTAAMGVVAGEAGAAADALVVAAEKRADERVAAADARIARSETAAAQSEQARMHALGQAEALTSEIDEQRAAHRAGARDLVKAHERESALRDEAGALRSEIAERGEALAHSETRVATLEQRLAEVEAAATAATAALERERSERAGEAVAHREAIAAADAATAAAAARETERAAALARLEERHAGAVVRADEALDRAARLERTVAALAAVRADDLARGDARIEQLIAALGEAGVGVPAPVPDPADDKPTDAPAAGTS